jgi:hypothetical protein
VYIYLNMLRILGVLHLIHGPSLIILPFLYDNYVGDLLYFDYFFVMMFCYTYFQRECPITYLSKMIQDPGYIPGSTPMDFPEITAIFPPPYSHKISYYLFITSSAGYMGSLNFVIYRLNIPPELLLIPFGCLSIYFSIPDKSDYNFRVYQEFIKVIMLSCIFIVSNTIIHQL